MKRLLLFCMLFASFVSLKAQDEAPCLPDSTFQDSLPGAYPLPFIEGQGGGLADFPACINDPYELVFTIVLTDSITTNGFALDIIDIKVDSVAGLPDGIEYFCNPPDCVFPDTVIGCVVLRGTPSATNAPGNYDLAIAGNANIGVPFPITFPGALAPGSYTITLNEEGSCEGVSTSVNYLSEQISLGNTPNPVTSQTKIEITSLLNGAFQFQVLDASGRVVHANMIDLNVGYNSFSFDASNLVDGMYFYTLSDGKAMVFEKMMVNR